MSSHLEYDLLLAVKNGDEALVKTLLEAEADPNAGAWARFEQTAVSLAIQNGYETILDELLSRGLLYGMTEERGPQRIATKSLPRDTSIKATLQIWIANFMLSVVRTISSSWLPNETDSTSPGERALEAVLRSNAATETMVIKLLDANLLASQPYRNSEVARKLLDLAVDRCWTTLASYLLDRETPVDTGPSETSRECHWPSLFGSVAHTLPYIDAKVIPERLLYRRKVISVLDEYHIERSMQVSTWAKAVSSRVFMDLSRSKSEHDRTTARVMLEILRRSSADPSKPDDNGLDALSHAVQQAYPCEVFEEVLQAWYDARSKNSIDAAPRGSAALYTAMNNTEPDLTRVTRLLDMGFSTEWEGADGRTPLWQAAYMNADRRGIDLLLSQEGADPDNGGSKGYPPILRTLHDNSHEKFVAFLEGGANANARGSDDKSILQVVLEHDPGSEVHKCQCLDSLLQHKVEIWNEQTQSAPAFETLARQSNSPGLSDLIFRLIIHQIPPDSRHKCYDKALRAAARAPRPELVIFGRCLFTIFLLLDLRADPCAATDRDGTLLHSICRGGHHVDSGHKWRSEMRVLLAREQIDINARDWQGCTALSLAVQSHHRDFALLLLEYGADPNIKDDKGQAPIQKLFDDKVGEYSMTCSREEVDGDSLEDYYRGERGQAEWHFVSRSRRIDIMESLDQEEIFQALVREGADLDTLDTNDRNLLMLACLKGNSVLTANVLYAAGEEQLSGALRHRDSSSQTAFHLAAKNGCNKVMRVLLTPSELFKPAAPNPWREMAVQNEKELAASEIHAHDAHRSYKAAQQQAKQWEHANSSVPSFLKGNVVPMERPHMPHMTIGGEERKTWSSMCLPNLVVKDWSAPRREETLLSYPKWTGRLGIKTPLLLAAQNGHLEIVELLVSAVDLNAGDIRVAAELALEKDYYDIHASLRALEVQASNRTM